MYSCIRIKGKYLNLHKQLQDSEKKDSELSSMILSIKEKEKKKEQTQLPKLEQTTECVETQVEKQQRNMKKKNIYT